MEKYKIIRLQEHSEMITRAAEWFHQKWLHVPEATYFESMAECARSSADVPQWYVVTDGSMIIGGLGVIENDFHERKDLTPNICALYVEEACRGQRIAGDLLQFVCDDFLDKGIDTLYLITDHTSFYERYGWEYLCMVQGEGEPEMTRMYVHQYTRFR